MDVYTPRDFNEHVTLKREIEKTPYANLLYGLWIEGATWNTKEQVLIDSDEVDSVVPFPMVFVKTCVSQIPDLEDAQNDERNFVDDPFQTRKELRDESLLAELEKANDSENIFHKLKAGMKNMLRGKYNINIVKDEEKELQEQRAKKKIYIYRCPVFASARRLSESDGGTGQMSTPVFYINLRTYDPPRKWIKRSVALLMEVSFKY